MQEKLEKNLVVLGLVNMCYLLLKQQQKTLAKIWFVVFGV